MEPKQETTAQVPDTAGQDAVETTQAAPLPEKDPEMFERDDISQTGVELSPEAIALAKENKKLDRRMLLKTDCIVLVILVLVSTFESLDKNSLGYSAILGLKTDTNLVGQEYSLLATIFYLGYLVVMPLTFYLNIKFPPARVVGICSAGWGALLICMSACNTFSGLAAVRFFLGMFEGSVNACFLTMISTWWSRPQQAMRTALIFNTFAGIFGGILAYPISSLKGPLAPWRYLFIIYGSITVVLGIFTTLILPSMPSDAWFFSPREKVRAAEHIKQNQQGRFKLELRRHQIMEAIKSPSYWTIVVFAISQAVTNAAVTNFNPLIINGFEYSAQRTTLLAVPQFAVCFVAQFGLSILALWIKNIRCTIWILSTLPCIAGACIIYLTDHDSQRLLALGGVYMMGFFNVAWIMALSLSASNTSGTTKKTFTNVTIGVCYAIGDMIGPQFFLGSEAPVYKTGLFALIVAYCLMFITGCVYMILQILENRRRKKVQDVPVRVMAADESDLLEDDVTDGENLYFRYSF